jgi:hypothetical protein
MEPWGIWCESDGGFIHITDTHEQAKKDLPGFIESDEDVEDLKLKAVCPNHVDEQQPADSCEECAKEY